MYILGLSFDYHDAAAALVKDGIVVAAAQEERFSRKKNDASFPSSAVEFCLKHEGITAGDIDHVTFYEQAAVKLDRILRLNIGNLASTRDYLISTIDSWMHKRKLYTHERISEYLGVNLSRIHSVSHHDAHSADAFFCSPFDEATIVTLDGVGEYETGTISIGKKNTIQRITSIELPHSLGLFYSAFTAYLGFRVDEDEYKVMGMAGYGTPILYNEIMKFFELYDDGRFSIDQKYFNFLAPQTIPYTNALIELLGVPREPESPFMIVNDALNTDPVIEKSKYYANVAASLQKCTEDVILHVVSRAIKRTGINNVCMSGGVALNSLANKRIKRELNCKLYIHPAAGDAGSALGSALYYYHQDLGGTNRQPLTNIYLGPDYSDHEIKEAISKSYSRQYIRYNDEATLIDTVARLLSEGMIIGWFQGRFEWGPRALGNRSILADPTKASMKDIVNEKIKFREPFRPFAPAVLAQRAAEYFDIGEINSCADPEYFMLAIGNVHPHKHSQVPAITHVDGTARVQLVERSANPIYHDLIARFEDYSGVPIILNTSFNLRGEPIINSPMDAFRTFEWCDMDYLVLGNYLIKKEI